MHYDDYFENLHVMNYFSRKCNLQKLTQKLIKTQRKSSILKDMSAKFKICCVAVTSGDWI